jgi:CheY-like chemotaxis protein
MANPKRVLVVDDEQDVRHYLRTALEDAGFIVETASDGYEALERLKTNPPDLISLDLVMPRHSGAMFHRELLKNRLWAKIPVLIVTGHARDDLGRADLEELTMSGPGVYLEKPVSPPAYVDAVRRLLGIETPELTMTGNDEHNLRLELLNRLGRADAATLKKALDELKKSDKT